ncbi:MAG: hypothetical protein EA380_07270 [Phycisphaeraceae bacterium]|nr:MAG: hypothetical protein EA380_07270 [Phycisphaeraceae bacterium]
MSGSEGTTPHGGDRRHDPEWEVTPRRVARLLADSPDSILLIDCRTDKERAIARIEGSMHIPMDRMAASVHEIDAAREGEDDDRRVIVYCHHGVRSLSVAVALRQQGIDGAVSMAGGIDAWTADVDPSVARY